MFLLAILIAAVSVLANSLDAQEINWVKIHSKIYPGVEIFYETGNNTTQEANNTVVNFGRILIVYDVDFEKTLLDRTFKARSVVKHVAIDCKTGITAPVSDTYFAMPFPGSTDRPIVRVRHSLTSVDMTMRLSKKLQLYSILCPTYI
jgi:hypothetical protein